VHEAHIRALGELIEVLEVTVLGVHIRAHAVHIVHKKMTDDRLGSAALIVLKGALSQPVIRGSLKSFLSRTREPKRGN
jgi:hypothetical protein